MATPKRQVLRDAWRLAKPYWVSEEKGRAWALLAAVIALNLTTVYLSVRFNRWQAAFWDAIQDYDEHAAFHQIMIFAGLAVIWVLASVYMIYFTQMLQLGWRRWLTRRYLEGWLANRAYYQMELKDSGTDNPDQRIQDDLDRFASGTLALFIGGNSFLNAGVTLVSFMTVLWGLSGTLRIPLGSFGTLPIPGYMVWAAVLYAVLGTWVTVRIGRPLVNLNFHQQRYEADFRFGMVRLRENGESVAFYRGEARELGHFQMLFGHVVDNFWSIMKRTKGLGFFTASFNQLGVLFPFFLAAPRYFPEKLTLGWMQELWGAFDQVQSSLNYIVDNYRGIAEWQSVVERLSGFEARLNDCAVAAAAPPTIAVNQSDGGLRIDALDLDLPRGEPLLSRATMEVGAGGALLITGPSGAGKSTLLRAIAGLWPFGRGRIRVGEGRVLFLPQRPYLPLGTLREALLYPGIGDTVSDERLVAVLTDVGLGHFAAELDLGSNWSHRLSLGEQQRLAFARIFLLEPAVVFLDEATSALDEAAEAELYRRLRAAPWHPTIVSVGHRSSLRQFHDRDCDISAFSPGHEAAAVMAP